MLSVNTTKTEEAGEMEMTNGEEQEERPKLWPRPRFNSKDYDFKKELARLPFPLNIGEVEFLLSQQKRFLELIYNDQSISRYAMRI